MRQGLNLFVNLLIKAVLLCAVNYAVAQTSDPRNAIPDLTNGDDQYSDPQYSNPNIADYGGSLTHYYRENDALTWNLGPTGMSGWFFRYDWWDKYPVPNATDPARQIEVQTVEVGSPADGIMQVGDVILGANGTGANPVAFTSDARKALAYAIADAEARTPAELKLRVWRAGSTSTKTITLETLGAYSATAPYNCPKSAAVLEKGLDAIMASGVADAYKFSLITLLAGNDPSNPDNAARMARAQQVAHELILPQADIDLYTSDYTSPGSKIAWELGFKLVALAEYYIHTNDPAVYDSLRAYAIACANGQSMFGTSGHRFTQQGADGPLNGPYAQGYGVVNSANMQCFYGLTLAREAGLTDQKIEDAIQRAASFYGSYVDRGSIAYGEGLPGVGTAYGENGKHGIAALCFKMVGNRNYDANYYATMAGSSAEHFDAGHQGPYLNYLWTPLGANAGGEESMVAFFAETSWRFDLARNWDGTFTYNSYQVGGQFDYGGEGWSVVGLRISTACLLPYAAPLREIYTTGKGMNNPAEWLTSAEVDGVELASGYDASSRSTTELLSDLASATPNMRVAAAIEISLRTAEHATLRPTLESIATDNNASMQSRMGACEALGEIANDNSLPLLLGVLSDPESLIKWAAARAIKKFSLSARMAEVDALMTICAAEGKPVLPIDPEDPIHHTNREIVDILFGFGADGAISGILKNHDLVGIDRDLLYPAIRAAMTHPAASVRKGLANIFDDLNKEDVEALAGVLVDTIATAAPAEAGDPTVQFSGIEVLEKFDYAEGVPLAKNISPDFGYSDGILGYIHDYAASSLQVEPDPNIVEFCEALVANGLNPTTAQAILDTIEGDTLPKTLQPFKGINWISNDKGSLTLPDNWTVLRADSYDHANGDTIYTWRKVRGAGDVTFTPNGTSSADVTAVTFDGAPGKYLFEVAMSDSRGLTEVSKTVKMDLLATDGSLPFNSQPTTTPQSVTAKSGAPIQIIFDAEDPEGYALTYTITEGPSHGSISGEAPYLVYTAAADFTGSDTITYEVMDSDGEVATATVTITVIPGGPVGLAIYEPFNYPTGALGGASGSTEIGLDGSWTVANFTYVESPDMGYGPLPTTGNQLWGEPRGFPVGSRPISPSALAGRGLLDDGVTLWFSLLVAYDGSAFRPDFHLALTNNGFDGFSVLDDGADPGSGLGFGFLGRKVYAAEFLDSGNDPVYGSSDLTINGHLNPGVPRLLVGKITWGANSDAIEVYLPGEDLVLPDVPASTLTTDIDQSKFNTLASPRVRGFSIDEIRFGATLQSVLQGTVEMTTDTTAPTPNPMSFNLPPTVAGPSSITMEAIPAYDPVGVEYQFVSTAGGGHSSTWQDSTVYTDTGLIPGVQYSYTVKARDKQQGSNQTAPSPAASVTLPAQGTVPDMVGMAQSTAESVIVDAGLSVGSITSASSYSLSVPAGHVISQNPSAASSVGFGAAVNLQISIGQNPNLPILASVDIVDDVHGGPLVSPAAITYTLTFSKNMNFSTFDSGDFVNLADLPITIGAITQLTAKTITVEVIANDPDVSGYVLFAIAEGAVIRDTGGHNLNTSSAIFDNQSIRISSPNEGRPIAFTREITYVDAAEGPSGNTFALGGSPSDTSWVNGTGYNTVDYEWKKRDLGEGGDVFESRTATAGNQVELTTQISGLADGLYDIWVFFWDWDDGDQAWDIAPGLTPGPSQIFSHDGLGNTTYAVAASTLNFATTPLFVDGEHGDFYMYGVYLGQKTVSGGSTVEVFVDDLTKGADNRTWYDGVGYSLVQDSVNNPPVVNAGGDDTVNLSAGADGAWTPADISTAAWYDASDTATITEAGGTVSQWNDKSGNGHHVTQASSNAQPISGTRTLNGNNVIDFVSNDSLKTSTSISGQPISYALVAEMNTADEHNTFFDANGSSRCLVRRRNDGSVGMYAGSWGPTGGTSISIGSVLVGGIFDGGSSEINADGVTLGTANPGSGNLSQGITIGNNNSPSANFDHNGTIGEIVIYSGVWDPETREKVEGHLAHKWGLSAKLPTGHPYKSVAPRERTSSGQATLNGTINDPDGDSYTSNWSVISGDPSAVIFADPSAEDTTATFTAPGTYVLELTANDGTSQTSDSVEIIVSNWTPAAWTPSDMSTTGWYDASDASTITESGGSVSKWGDKSGNELHLNQSNGERRPTTGSATINGFNAIDFDGTNDTLATSKNPFGATINDGFVIAVHRVDSISAGTSFSLSGSSSSSMRWQAHAPRNDGITYFDSGSTSGAGRVQANYGVNAGDNVLVSYYSSTSDNVQQIRKDGALLVGDTSGHSVNTAGNIHIGSNGSTGEHAQDTSFGEVIIINGTVSLEDRERLEGYLAHKWGLVANLPAGHTYKSAAPNLTYANWAKGLSDRSLTADLDNDGMSNLMEFALGGNPLINDAVTLKPMVQTMDDALVFTYRRLTDAEARGLTYTVIMSEDMAFGNWTTNGMTEIGVSPAEKGMELVTNRIDAIGRSRFVRLKVTLTENGEE